MQKSLDTSTRLTFVSILHDAVSTTSLSFSNASWWMAFVAWPLVELTILPLVRIFRIFPAIMHPFGLGNWQNGKKPAILHPLENFLRFQDEKSKKPA